MEKIKESLAPFLVGVVLGMILLSFGFGFMSKSSAEQIASDAAEQASVVALVPLCLSNAAADPDGMAELLGKSSFQRRSAIAATGWAVYPADASPQLKRAIDQGCVDALVQ